MTAGKTGRRIADRKSSASSTPGSAAAEPGYGRFRYSLIERRLKARSKKRAHIPPAELALALRANPGVPLPPAIHECLCELLEGNVRAPAGRRADREKPLLFIKKTLIPVYYSRYHAWLKRRDRSMGLEGWRSIRDADWWQGPPAERAARMTCRRLGLAIGWRRVQNIVSEAHNGH